MMEFQHWPWAIKFCLNKMTGVLGKIIKVFEVIVAVLKTLKNQLMKNVNNWRRFSPQLLGSVEKADVKATRAGQKIHNF